jgi:hypothetical protein
MIGGNLRDNFECKQPTNDSCQLWLKLIQYLQRSGFFSKSLRQTMDDDGCQVTAKAHINYLAFKPFDFERT